MDDREFEDWLRGSAMYSGVMELMEAFAKGFAKEQEMIDSPIDEIARERGMVPKADLDAVYRERNRLVAALTRLAPRLEWEVAMEQDDEETGWYIVYLVTEAGQLSWHVSEEEAIDLFAHVPDGLDISWDGHDTNEKYRRLARIGVSHG